MTSVCDSFVNESSYVYRIAISQRLCEIGDGRRRAVVGAMLRYWLAGEVLTASLLFTLQAAIVYPKMLIIPIFPITCTVKFSFW